MTVEEVWETCRTARVRYCNERDVQLALADIFEVQGWEAAREVQLAPGERIDFLMDRTGIEVKIKGSTPHVLEQLMRYGATGQLDYLILVTSRAKHRELAGTIIPGLKLPLMVARLPWL